MSLELFQSLHTRLSDIASQDGTTVKEVFRLLRMAEALLKDLEHRETQVLQREQLLQRREDLLTRGLEHLADSVQARNTGVESTSIHGLEKTIHQDVSALSSELKNSTQLPRSPSRDSKSKQANARAERTTR